MAAKLTVAVGDYDHTRDVIAGRVRAHGVELTCVAVDSPEELFRRVLEAGEFDAAELSLAVCCALRARGDDRFVAIPVFPARSFRHSSIYTRVNGPTSPRELAGGRIGIPVWAQTAGVYARGILASRYGLRLDGVRWVQAGVDVAGREEPVDLDHGPYDVRPSPDRSLDELLLAGDVDAVISARPPASVVRGDPRVRHLFADPMAEEAAYFRDTGVFPIMHVLVLRRGVYEAAPEVAGSLYEAFDEARRRSLARSAASPVPVVPLPWTALQAHEARRLLGEDYWCYGLEPNRAALDVFMGYAHEQRLTERRLAPEELLAVEFASRQRT